MDDEDAWAVANPALGDFLYVDALRSTMRTTREADFRRFRWGQWTHHADGWLPRDAWLACIDGREIPDGAEVVLGFDGSYSGDATAIVAVELGDVPHLDVVRLWENPGQQVADHRRRGRAPRSVQTVGVQTIVADPFRWARSLQMLASTGYPSRSSHSRRNA
jgi:phage terminase large subunit-like protein